MIKVNGINISLMPNIWQKINKRQKYWKGHTLSSLPPIAIWPHRLTKLASFGSTTHGSCLFTVYTFMGKEQEKKNGKNEGRMRERAMKEAGKRRK